MKKLIYFVGDLISIIVFLVLLAITFVLYPVFAFVDWLNCRHSTVIDDRKAMYEQF